MKGLTLGKVVVNNSLARYARYGGLAPVLGVDYHDIVQDVVKSDLNRSLGFITEDMNAEAEVAIMEMLGNIPDWNTIDLRPIVHRLAARISSRVFIGSELSNNAEWLDIATSYATNAGRATRKLRSLHPLLRPFGQWWFPELRSSRRLVAKARKIINPIAQDRLRRKANGQSTEKTSDMLSWLDDQAKAKGVKIDFADFQLLFVVVAVHTTTEAVSMLMADLIENKEAIPQLREEISSTLSTHGWKKTSLASMKLLDSAMKESQRMNPVSDPLANITLSDGTIIPKGYKLAVEHRLQDPTLYPNVDKFELDRFLKLSHTDNKWTFVTGSPEHLSFGYGKHVCPGRFFASNEIKIIVIHMLLKYDWKFNEEGRLPCIRFEADRYFDPRQKVVVKSRQEDIDLRSPLGCV
ncbi:cytochrome P450 [Alternaria alternata]|nr:cytochrome P450 [Alternaria alternata]OWY45903.1 cytochrome P450 [Alternaria alternata]